MDKDELEALTCGGRACTLFMRVIEEAELLDLHTVARQYFKDIEDFQINRKSFKMIFIAQREAKRRQLQSVFEVASRLKEEAIDKNYDDETDRLIQSAPLSKRMKRTRYSATEAEMDDEPADHMTDDQLKNRIIQACRDTGSSTEIAQQCYDTILGKTCADFDARWAAKDDYIHPDNKTLDELIAAASAGI